jgi:uncharacterized protein YacL
MGLRIGGIFFSGLFAFGSGLLGYDLSRVFLTWLETHQINPFPYTVIPALAIAIIGALVGFLVGAMLYRRMVELGQGLKRIPAEDKIASVFGTTFSLIIAAFVDNFILQQQWKEHVVTFAVSLLATVIIVWLGNVIALSMKDEWKYLMPGMAARQSAPTPVAAAPTVAVKLLDTNVIIDGRIYDICRSGFLDGQIILPGFVLEELHHIADSADALRRNRGRRGLDILHQMQTELDNSLRIVDKYKVSFAPSDGVDMKLVKLAKGMNADVVTNDFNLNKVAKLHGVRVLNVNELANAVKPVVLPGEELVVNIVREGKEYNQGVGYLDDGTMVVVENGKRMLGDTVSVSVSSVLQTVAGKMIFAELKAEHHGEDSDENSSYYAGRGNRRKTM